MSDSHNREKTTNLLGTPIVHMFDVKIFEIIRLLSKVGQPMPLVYSRNAAHVSEDIEEQG